MPRLVTVGKEGSLAAGRSKKVFCGDHRIAVFNDGGTLRAVDDACTHVGGPLSDGSWEDGVVTQIGKPPPLAVRRAEVRPL